jgi:hypothetical protein
MSPMHQLRSPTSTKNSSSNPSLLTLVRQRGNLDCGGADFVLVRYGNFYQLIIPLQDGHVSVCFEPDANPLTYTEAIRALVE